ncbi:MAG: hypothetical protein HQL77_12675 [Magnetococcales bacterium]|nr:hypothetical protein [Magnetococcales bacterium]
MAIRGLPISPGSARQRGRWWISGRNLCALCRDDDVFAISSIQEIFESFVPWLGLQGNTCYCKEEGVGIVFGLDAMTVNFFFTDRKLILHCDMTTFFLCPLISNIQLKLKDIILNAILDRFLQYFL